MKCEICHQNEAETVLYRPGKDGGRPEELYVCKACAERERAFGQERGIQVAAVDGDSIVDMPETGMPPGPNPGLPPGFDQLKVPKEVMGRLGEMFSELSKHMQASENDDDDDSEEDSEARCPRCGMPADELRRHALAGCPDCYRAHRKLIASLLEQIQQSSEFHGDPFPGSERVRDLESLKTQQREAIEKEDYRQAKLLGEQINALVNSPDTAQTAVPKSVDEIDDFDPDDPDNDEQDDDDEPPVSSPEEAAEALKRAIARALANGRKELADRLSRMLRIIKGQIFVDQDDEEPEKAKKTTKTAGKAEKKPAKAKKAAKTAEKAEKKPAKATKTAEKTEKKPAKATKTAEKAEKKPAKAAKTAEKAEKKPAKATKKPAKAAKTAEKAEKKPAKATKKPVKAAKKSTKKDGETGK